MADQSHLDRKYFIDSGIYNCPFCNRRHVTYELEDQFRFSWSATKPCYGYVVECSSCHRRSMHLSFTNRALTESGVYASVFQYNGDLDDAIFYQGLAWCSDVQLFID